MMDRGGGASHMAPFYGVVTSYTLSFLSLHVSGNALNTRLRTLHAHTHHNGWVEGQEGKEEEKGERRMEWEWRRGENGEGGK